MKKYRRVTSTTLKSDAKFEEKRTLCFKDDMKNLVNCNASSGKSENLHFNVLLLSIAFKVSARFISPETEKRFKLSQKTEFLFET